MDNTMYTKTVAPVFRGVAYVYNKTHWFTDKEAWSLFRLFAICEAIGWTLLISGIIYKSLHLPGGSIVLSMAGRTHGVFFGFYFIFALLTARSMQWGFWRVSVALLAGIGPYTSLMYELVMAHDRKKRPVHGAPPSNID